MALLHEKSAECTLGELDLFSAPMTQMSIEEKMYTEVLPLSAITDGGPIEFFIPGDGEKHQHLTFNTFELKLPTQTGQTSPQTPPSD